MRPEDLLTIVSSGNYFRLGVTRFLSGLTVNY